VDISCQLRDSIALILTFVEGRFLDYSVTMTLVSTFGTAITDAVWIPKVSIYLNVEMS
jgi:hypothetical protein